jgi:hypothetical protein
MELIMQAVVENPTQIQLQIAAAVMEELLFSGKQEVVNTSLVQDQQKLATHLQVGILLPMEVVPLTQQQEQSHLVQT